MDNSAWQKAIDYNLDYLKGVTSETFYNHQQFHVCYARGYETFGAFADIVALHEKHKVFTYRGRDTSKDHLERGYIEFAMADVDTARWLVRQLSRIPAVYASACWYDKHLRTFGTESTADSEGHHMNAFSDEVSHKIGRRNWNEHTVILAAIDAGSADAAFEAVFEKAAQVVVCWTLPEKTPISRVVLETLDAAGRNPSTTPVGSMS